MRSTILDEFDLDVPDAWEDATLVTLLGPADDRGARPSVVVGRDALVGGDLAAYAREQLARMRRETEGFEEHRAAADGDGRFVAEHTFSLPGGAPVRQVQVFLARGDRVLTLSATVTASGFARAADEVRRIVDSFRTR